jgi:hypothetical protein
MCNERWMRRWPDESREGRRLWDEFERTSPVTQPEMPADEPEIKLEERNETFGSLRHTAHRSGA